LTNDNFFIVLICYFINRISLIRLRSRIMLFNFIINYLVGLLETFNLLKIENKFLYFSNERP